MVRFVVGRRSVVVVAEAFADLSLFASYIYSRDVVARLVFTHERTLASSR